MKDTIKYWCDLYNKFKYRSACIDLEGNLEKGDITVAGIYKPKEGLAEVESFVKGRNLTHENLKKALEGCKMIITFYGTFSDIPALEKAFPGVIPKDAVHFDLFLFARGLGIKGGLKDLEKRFKVFINNPSSRQKGLVGEYFRLYKKYKEEFYIQKKIEYNKEDTLNLFPLCEELVKIAVRQLDENRS